MMLCYQFVMEVVDEIQSRYRIVGYHADDWKQMAMETLAVDGSLERKRERRGLAVDESLQ